MYLDLFSRVVDPLAMYWVGLLDADTPANNVAAEILQSPEARQTRLNQLYQLHLYRSPDGLGMGAFMPTLLNDRTDAGVISVILSSEEYYKKRAGG